MEFDSLFTGIQGIMRSHQRITTVPFGKLHKDNDLVSSKIIDALECLISELGLKEEHIRRINLFLVVNTDFPSISALEDDKNFWHLLGCLPKMSPYLYFKISTHLKFHTYIGEVIYFCPEFLAIEIFEAINGNLKYLNPDISVQFFQSLFEKGFLKVLNLLNDKRPSIVIKRFLNALKTATAFDFKELLSQQQWPAEKKDIFFGYVIKMSLSVLESFIAKMNNSFEFQSLEVYDFDVDFDYAKWGDCENSINWTNHCLSLIVGKCIEVLECIVITMFMHWFEEDVGGAAGRTLQNVVREGAYNCREKVKTILHMSEEIGGLKRIDFLLSEIACQPLAEDDEIKNANAETIVINLLNPNRTQTKWLKALINVPGIFQSPTYMQVICDNAHIFDLDVAKVLLDALLEFLSNSQCPRDIHEAAKDCFFSCLKKQPLTLQMDLLSYYFDKRCSSNLLQTENFEYLLVETMNKFSATEENKVEILSEIVKLSFENSEDVVRLLLRECLSSRLKADLLLGLLSEIQPLARHPCNSSHLGLPLRATVHLMESVLTSLDKKKDNFVQLVTKLCAMGLIERNILFPEHVLPRFEESVKLNEVPQINFYLDVLQVYVSQSSPPPNSAALLMFFAKFLDEVRPSISNFTLERMNATSKTVELVQKLTKNIIRSKKLDETGGELAWLREASAGLRGLSRLHLRELWSAGEEEGCPPQLPAWATPGLGLGEELSTVSPLQRRTLVTSVLKVLPTLTLSEWLLLGSLDSVKGPLLISTIEAVTDSVLVSLELPFLIKKPEIINNMIINFSQFLWEKGVPELKKLNEKMHENLLEKITHLGLTLPEDLKKSRVPQLQLIVQAISK